MKNILIMRGVRYVNYPVEEGKIVLLDKVLADPVYVKKFLTLDELLYLEKHFSDFRVLFPLQGKILAGRVKGREHVCSSFWWNENVSGINETLVKGVILPGRKGYSHYLLIRKD